MIVLFLGADFPGSFVMDDGHGVAGVPFLSASPERTDRGASFEPGYEMRCGAD